MIAPYLPDSIGQTEPTVPIDEITNPKVIWPSLLDYPFQMSEISTQLKQIRRYSRRYVEQVDEIRLKAREFSHAVIRPIALKLEKKISEQPDYFEHEVMSRACEHGFFTLLVPKELGGGGYCSIHACVMAEELAAGCAGLASTIGVHSGALACGLVSGDMYLLDHFVRPVVAAERRRKPILWAGAVTEPNAGTDIWDEEFLKKGNIGTTAKRVTDGYVLNGRKCFVSNGSVADMAVVAAAVDPKNVAKSWSLFIVPTNAKGFSIGRIERKLGQKSSPAAELIFDDLFLPERNLIGLEGNGMHYVSVYLAGSRGPVGAIGTGCARRSLECLVDWAKQKRVNGRLLIEQQWVQMQIASMARDVVMARQAYMQAAVMYDQILVNILGQPFVKVALNLIPKTFVRSKIGRRTVQSKFVKEKMWTMLLDALDEQKLAHVASLATIAKIVGSDTGVRVAGEVMRIMGHDAFDPRWPVEKCYRDAKLTQIYEGTNQANAITQFKGMASSWTDSNNGTAEGRA